MPLDPNIILGIRPAEPVDPLTQAGKVLGIKGALQQQDLQSVQLQEAQRNFESGTKIRALLQANPNATPEQVMAIDPEKGIAFRKSALENAKNQAELQKTQQEVLGKAISQHRDDLANVNTPEDMAHWLAAGYADPITGPILSKQQPLADAISKIPTDPAAFQDMKNKQALGATAYIKANAPHYSTQDTGASSQIVATPGLGGKPQVVSTTPKTATPGEIMTDKRQRELNGIMEGMSKGPSPDLVDAIGKGEIELPKPPTNARNPMMLQRYAETIAAVKEKYPNWSNEMFPTIKKTIQNFAVGKQGDTVKALNTATDHLETISELAKAANSGNVQLFNKIATAWAANTGNPAPSNLNGAAQIIGGEIVKGIVGAGGGVEERAKAEHAFSSIKSPADVQGAVNTVTQLMGGQFKGLRQQYEAGTYGRKDFSEKYLTPAARRALERATAGKESAPGAATPARPELGERRDGYIYKGGDPADPKSWDK